MTVEYLIDRLSKYPDWSVSVRFFTGAECTELQISEEDFGEDGSVSFELSPVDES